MKRGRNYFLLLVLFVFSAGILTQQQLQADGTRSGKITPCINGFADIYPCKNVDLLAHMSLQELGAGTGVKGSDHWGWTDPLTGKDYVLFGLTNGTVFIDISDRLSPLVIGTLPSHDGSSVWRDIKVYKNYAYITADVPTNHGLQLFDLTRLRDVQTPPVTFKETDHYDGFGPGHNLWVNEETGYLYVFRSDTCNGEMHIINVQDPGHPQFAGCFEVGDAPLSDSECIVYQGPDQDYQGHELCFTGSDDNVSIGDVSDKGDPQLIADFTYLGISRAHQGALTPDQAYWLLSDTMDEENNGTNTRTYVFDIHDLINPLVLGYYEHGTTARDHNLYIVGDTAYETNWQAGLRVLLINSLPQTNFLEAGYFDIVPGSDSIAASGSWSNFPWWSDGVVTVSGTDEGLFILQPRVNQQHMPLVTAN